MIKWISTVIIGLLIAYCGSVLVFIGINGSNAYNEIERYGKTTEGTITKISTQDSWQGQDTYLTVEYQVNSMDYSYVEKQGCFDRDANEGDTLTVVYDSLQPLFAEEERTTFEQKWGYHFAGGGAVILLGAGISFYGLRIRKMN